MVSVISIKSDSTFLLISKKKTNQTIIKSKGCKFYEIFLEIERKDIREVQKQIENNYRRNKNG